MLTLAATTDRVEPDGTPACSITQTSYYSADPLFERHGDVMGFRVGGYHDPTIRLWISFFFLSLVNACFRLL